LSPKTRCGATRFRARADKSPDRLGSAGDSAFKFLPYQRDLNLLIRLLAGVTLLVFTNQKESSSNVWILLRETRRVFYKLVSGLRFEIQAACRGRLVGLVKNRVKTINAETNDLALAA
jgi:hypothetical protein